MSAKRPLVYPLLVGLVIAFASGGCVTQRTVTQNGNVVSQDYVVERPIRDALMGKDD